MRLSKVVIEFNYINVFGVTEGKFRRGRRRVGCKVEVSENMKVIRYSNERLWYCWREISIRGSDNEVRCMIMCVSRDRNMLVRLVDDNRFVNCWEEESRGSSRCMLKSPVIVNSCEVVAADKRKVRNLSRPASLSFWSAVTSLPISLSFCVLLKHLFLSHSHSVFF